MGTHKKKILAKIFAGVSPMLLTAAVAAMVFYGLGETEKSSRAEGRRILEDSVRRAVVKCYAVEGRYPESLAYIGKNYGIIIDRSRYLVDYDIFASNIMPSIRVIELL